MTKKYVTEDAPGLLHDVVAERHVRCELLPRIALYPADLGLIYEKDRVRKEGDVVVSRFPVTLAADELLDLIMKSAPDEGRKFRDAQEMEEWVIRYARDPVAGYGWPEGLSNLSRWAQAQVAKNGIVPIPHSDPISDAIFGRMGYHAFRVFGTYDAERHKNNSRDLRHKVAQLDVTPVGQILRKMGLETRF